MDKIYSMATFTIVAAVDGASDPGLPGLSRRPRSSFTYNMRTFDYEIRTTDSNFVSTVDRSIWNSRGWTFQERILSRRCLFVSEYQTFFRCRNNLFEEELGQCESPTINRHLFASEMISLDDYLECVAQYTTRKLSFEWDILNAFARVSEMLSNQLNTPFVYGLPEAYFPQALL
jgi:hypothetical protein